MNECKVRKKNIEVVVYLYFSLIKILFSSLNIMH